MTPIPIGSLPPTVLPVELAIRPVPLAKVGAVGMVFAVVPLMVVPMVAIVVAGITAVAITDYHFLGSACPGR
jgi:hypothetical protein